MASDTNKKLIILYVLEILKKYSDSSHPLTQQEIIKKIESIYGMTCSSDFSLKQAGQKKTATYIILPDEKTTYSH